MVFEALGRQLANFWRQGEADSAPVGAVKVCQLTGETDRQFGRPTVNRTESRFGFWGTDLGASFEHKGRLYFLFGDTHPVPGVNRPPNCNMIATADANTPEPCLELDFRAEADGAFRPLIIPGVPNDAAFAVPTGGFSTGDALYIICTADFSHGNTMGRSVLARSRDQGFSFERVCDISTTHFINVAPVVVDAASISGLPAGTGSGVLMWASGRYRASNPRLAFAPVDTVEDRASWHFFAGCGPGGKPVWETAEDASVPLFDDPHLGELSVGWNPVHRRWMMLYNADHPEGRIYLRTAPYPWGPWTDRSALFDPWRDRGYGYFIHTGGQPGFGKPYVSDPHTPHQKGDPYGPYLISKFTRDNGDGSATIYFLMSTWNPYGVVLMKAVVRDANGT